MSTPYRRDFERLRYWKGQAMRSIDARDQSRFDALRRQLHNRALHSTGGVGFGLHISQPADDPQSVEVGCGLAYDDRGRELVLQRPRSAALPAEPGWLMLRVRATKNTSSCCPSSDPGCIPEATQLLEDDVELVWTAFASFAPLVGVALAIFDGTQLDATFNPRQARPLAKPRLARGETVRGDTPWEPWTIEEPDGKGGVLTRVVGVQTHVDTSAVGFTRRPSYIATLQSQEWLAKAEFAPAFFPHVADPAPDGFTFRLLMTEIARRRYNAWFGTARVAATKRGIGDRLQVEVDAMASFKQGDVIAQLRPRARTVVQVEKIAKGKLTLAAPLADVHPGTTMLAVGNLPRVAVVAEVGPDDPAIVAAFTAAPPIKKGDVLRRTADGALAVIDRVAQGKLTVGAPFADWKTTDALMVARMSAAADVKSAVLSPDGSTMTLELKPASHSVAIGMTVILLDSKKLPFATVSKVTSRTGATIEAQPGLSATELADLARVAPLAAGITIQSLQPKSRSIVKVDTVGPFAVGDFVAASDNSAQIAVVEQINATKKQLELSAVLSLKVGSELVGVNWQSATTVSALDAKRPNEVVVGRPNAAAPGFFVALRTADDFATPVPVTTVNDTLLTLASPLLGATRLDTLAVGLFPRIATVIAQQAQEEQIVIAEAGALAAGDTVMLFPVPGATAAEASVVQVVAANGTQIVLAESLGKLDPGRRLAPIHWRDRVSLTAVEAANPARIDVDGDVDFRENDVVGVLTHHGDCSNPGYVEKIEGHVLTLSLPGIEQGDGIVDHGWIDGGIVGPAAVSYLSPLQFSFPSKWQPIVRMATVDGLDGRAPAVAYGLDLLTGRYLSHAVFPFLMDGAGGHVVFLSPGSNDAYRYRPETLSLITSFNTDFPRAFATFAQTQKLAVHWIGCLQEFPSASGCPGQEPYDPCAQDTSSEG